MTPIRLRGWTVRFGERLVLDDLDLDLPPVGMVSLMGPSGSGKSTLLGALAGRGPVEAGERCVGNPPPVVAWILQSSPLLRHRSAIDNVCVAALAGGASRSDAVAASRDAMSRLGIADLSESVARTLSGGEQQRVAVARAIVAGADVVLADEPSAALDERSRDLLGVALRTLAERLTVVVATHDGQLAAMADHRFVLRGGRLVACEEVGER